MRYRSGLAFNRPSGGREEVLIVEQNRKAPPAHYEYRLVAIGEMATLQKELQAAGDAGFRWRETLYATTRRRPSVLILERKRGARKVRYEYQVRRTRDGLMMPESSVSPPGYEVDIRPIGQTIFLLLFTPSDHESMPVR